MVLIASVQIPNPVPKDEKIKFHSSSKLTKYNSNFNNNYKAAASLKEN